jgi:riboflavin-specific deaminase-like protein
MSIDGYIDDMTTERLRLSDEEDFDRVDQVRAESDAIMVGATTLRRDDPRLRVKSAERRAARAARGLPEELLRVVVTASGDISRDLRVWGADGDKVIYCPDAAADRLRATLGDLADIVPLGGTVDFGALLDDLGRRGIRRLMVEGGTTVNTRFLAEDLADEIHLAVAPFFVGDARAPRFVNPGDFPDSPKRRMKLAEVRPVGDMALLRYLPSHEPQLSPDPVCRLLRRPSSAGGHSCTQTILWNLPAARRGAAPSAGRAGSRRQAAGR